MSRIKSNLRVNHRDQVSDFESYMYIYTYVPMYDDYEWCMIVADQWEMYECMHMWINDMQLKWWMPYEGYDHDIWN